ncbi:MAG: alpha/beta fold hydrolase [Rhodocyclaceae bacterium]|nr:alpha/beta fold hydrolase [Rhodocyclaceae bacterium]
MKLQRMLLVALTGLALAGSASAQEAFDIKQGDSIVSALNFGQGDHVVIALHGNRGSRDFFADYGPDFAKAGLRVISINWPGTAGAGFSELSAAVKYAKEQGSKKVSLLGFSRGAELAANFARSQGDGEFDTLVLISTVDDQGLAMAKTKKVFAFNKGDSIARWAPASAEKSAEPKMVFALGGGGHPIKSLVAEKADLMQDVIAAIKK